MEITVTRNGKTVTLVRQPPDKYALPEEITSSDLVIFLGEKVAMSYLGAGFLRQVHLWEKSCKGNPSGFKATLERWSLPEKEPTKTELIKALMDAVKSGDLNTAQTVEKELEDK